MEEWTEVISIYLKKRSALDDKEAYLFNDHYILKKDDGFVAVFTLDGELVREDFAELEDALWFLSKQKLSRTVDAYYRHLFTLPEKKIKEIYQKSVMNYLERKNGMNDVQEKKMQNTLDALLLLSKRKAYGKEYNI